MHPGTTSWKRSTWRQPIESLYTYAMTKRMLYQGARALNKQYGLKYLCAVRPRCTDRDTTPTAGRCTSSSTDPQDHPRQELGEPVVLWVTAAEARGRPDR